MNVTANTCLGTSWGVCPENSWNGYESGQCLREICDLCLFPFLERSISTFDEEHAC